MNYTPEEMLAIARKFETTGNITEIKPLGPGFINDTFIVKTQGEKASKYILQRKNHQIFPDVPGMMKNIEMVTEHIRKKVIAEGGDPLREVLTVTLRKPGTMTDAERADPAGHLYFRDAKGNYWTMCVFIEGSVTYEKADTPELCYKGGKGIACIIGISLVAHPFVTLIAFAAGLIFLIIVKIGALASFIMIFVPNIYEAYVLGGTQPAVSGLIFAMLTLAVLAHHANLVRLFSGTENLTVLFKKKPKDK